MTMRLRSTLLVGVAAALMLPLQARAASGDADGAFIVTIEKLELSKDGGTTFTTVFSGSQSINIAAVNAGAVAAGLVSGLTLDTGTYDTVRVTIGGSLQVKGYANSGGSTYYTDGGVGIPAAFSINVGVLNTPGPTYATSTYTVPVANRVDTTTGLAIRVAPGEAPTVRVAFDTSGVLQVGGGVLVPGAPSVTVTSR